MAYELRVNGKIKEFYSVRRRPLIGPGLDKNGLRHRARGARHADRPGIRGSGFDPLAGGAGEQDRLLTRWSGGPRTSPPLRRPHREFSSHPGCASCAALACISRTARAAKYRCTDCAYAYSGVPIMNPGGRELAVCTIPSLPLGGEPVLT